MNKNHEKLNAIHLSGYEKIKNIFLKHRNNV